MPYCLRGRKVKERVCHGPNIHLVPRHLGHFCTKVCQLLKIWPRGHHVLDLDSLDGIKNPLEERCLTKMNTSLCGHPRWPH